MRTERELPEAMKLRRYYYLSSWTLQDLELPEPHKSRLLEYTGNAESKKIFDTAEQLDTALSEILGAEVATPLAGPIRAAALSEYVTAPIRFSFLPLVLDLASRWVVFLLLDVGGIGPMVAWGLQVAITFAVLFFVFERDDKTTKHLRTLLPASLRERKVKVQTDVQVSAWGFLCLAAGFCAMAYTGLNVWPFSDWQEGLGWSVLKYTIVTVLLAAYGAYLLAVFFTSGRAPKPIDALPTDEASTEQMAGAVASAPGELTVESTDRVRAAIESVALSRDLSLENTQLAETEIDQNDLSLTELDVQTASMSRRVDTYTLESALFGALAFSAFLTLITSDPTTIEEIKALLDIVGVMLTGAGPLHENIELLRETERLQALIAIETLFCSLF
ncbi:MAG: hypothetical protein AAGD38_21850, partial [Acidobacteriota bacterium]